MDNQYSIVNKIPKQSDTLNTLLKEGKLGNRDIDKIASALAEYHKDLDIVRNAFDINGFQDDYEEIKRCSEFVDELLDPSYSALISKSIVISRKFLNSLRLVIQERVITGMMRDGHGDLNASSIFTNGALLIREEKAHHETKYQIDVINDLARLGVDFDFYGFTILDEELFDDYMRDFGDENNRNTHALYNYFKLFHTSKIILNLIDNTTIKQFSERKAKILRDYFEIFKQYLETVDNYLEG